MTMQETFGIGAFRSRQQVMRFDSALRRTGHTLDVNEKNCVTACGHAKAWGQAGFRPALVLRFTAAG